jgi:hypothetical protein
MLIREYVESDLAVLRRMHTESGLGYAFPDLRDPLFVSKLVAADPDGRPSMAAFARLTCEMYLIVDRADKRSQAAKNRYTTIEDLHRAGEADLLAKGLEDAHAWLPPTIATRFGRRLEAFGWVRDDHWTPYCRRLRG